VVPSHIALPNNAIRAEWGERILKVFIGWEPSNLKATVTDALACIMHYCAQEKIAFAECLDQADKRHAKEAKKEKKK